MQDKLSRYGRLHEIVKKMAWIYLPSIITEQQLAMFTNGLIAKGVVLVADWEVNDA